MIFDEWNPQTFHFCSQILNSFKKADISMKTKQSTSLFF